MAAGTPGPDRRDAVTRTALWLSTVTFPTSVPAEGDAAYAQVIGLSAAMMVHIGNSWVHLQEMARYGSEHSIN
jgi:hypothetical protein